MTVAEMKARMDLARIIEQWEESHKLTLDSSIMLLEKELLTHAFRQKVRLERTSMSEADFVCEKCGEVIDDLICPKCSATDDGWNKCPKCGGGCVSLHDYNATIDMQQQEIDQLRAKVKALEAFKAHVIENGGLCEREPGESQKDCVICWPR